MDAQAILYAEGETLKLLQQMESQLASIFIVSQVTVKAMDEAPSDAISVKMSKDWVL